jgi:formyltetrahydrofolate hydrolase
LILATTGANFRQRGYVNYQQSHPDLEPIAKQFGIDYHYLPITQDNKQAQQQRQLELLNEYPDRLNSG